MGYQTDLQVGFAELLAADGIGVWDPSAPYGADVIGIALQALALTPDAGISLTTYPVASDPTLSDSVTGLQVMTRTAGADPRTTNDLSDLIFDVLHGAHDLTLSTGIRVVEVEHRSGSLLGQDDQKRWSRSDNYYVTTHRPSPNRQ